MGTILIRLIKVSFILFVYSDLQAQISGDVSIGVLQSVGANKNQVISSSTQAVAIHTTTTRRYNQPDLRVRLALSKSLTEQLNLLLQSGFTQRLNERLWGESFDYISFPIQGGGSYKLVNKRNVGIFISACSGINIFKIHDQLAKQQGGFIQSGELKCLIGKHGRFKSIILKTGYEFQIDKEAFYFKPFNPVLKDEEFHYKVKRNQLYAALGLQF